MNEVRLELTAPPHLKAPDTTRRIMWSVVGSLSPVVVAAAYFSGPSALLVIGAATAGAVVTERMVGPRGSLGDGSAAITGLLLGLILPAGILMWMAFLGGAFGIGFGKLLFGGLGQNVFNPALIGRAFLQAAFPTAITTWPASGMPWGELRGDTFALPLLSPQAPDVVTAATPLGLWKFEATPTEISSLMLGNTGGSLGETAGLLILVCGGYLALKNYLNWRIPVSIFATVGAASAVLHALDATRYPGPLFMLFSGGLILGAMYMATDMVTSPVTNAGAWVFGVGIGVLVVLIRTWGGLPEGVMYAILLMNALVPFINRATQPRVFGHSRKEAPA
ncbi:MAG: RnfABCDGE type electron transport complex subunit D [Gemmatimonadota bacterium]